MSDTVIRVENLSKQYRLGTVGTGALAHDLNRWWCKLRGKPDPYLKVTQSNDRAHKSDSEYVWALRDINFEVKRGEVLGIIGRNGAGKSTLLKILSRITAPTEGAVKVLGRIASLLEVGTGFHPELTGRENIFLNGAILGMTKAEIRAKLDEIIDFSGCERYLDTPVKRYSSGMMVRLGFAVAAHLEPEILIVDEVLAVGDAEFQKKCVGKMKNVAKHGRTVLFVSHNMAAATDLCDSAIVLADGAIAARGSVSHAIAYYMLSCNRAPGQVHLETGSVAVSKVEACYSVKSPHESEISVGFTVDSQATVDDFRVDIGVENESGVRIAQFVSARRGIEANRITVGTRLRVSFGIIVTPLVPGSYTGTIYAYSAKNGVLLHLSGVPLFKISHVESSCMESLSPGYTAILNPVMSYRIESDQER